MERANAACWSTNLVVKAIWFSTTSLTVGHWAKNGQAGVSGVVHERLGGVTGETHERLLHALDEVEELVLPLLDCAHHRGWHCVPPGRVGDSRTQHKNNATC